MFSSIKLYNGNYKIKEKIKKEENKMEDKNENLLNYLYINEFRKQTLEERIKLSEKIICKYNKRIPIIVDCKKEIILDKKKYIVPNDLTVSQFMYCLKKRIKLSSEQSIFLLCNNKLMINSDLINNIYNKEKDTDGFLYIIICLENTFGTN